VDGYLTTGQVARKLRVSVSTLKRWLDEPCIVVSDVRNANGWRLFDENAVEVLRRYKRSLKRRERKFSEATLIPVTVIRCHDQGQTVL